eukprot:1221490-Amphidinium_carterae.1
MLGGGNKRIISKSWRSIIEQNPGQLTGFKPRLLLRRNMCKQSNKTLTGKSSLYLRFVSSEVEAQHQCQQLQDLLAKQSVIRIGREITDFRDSKVAELRETQVSDLIEKDKFAEFKLKLTQHNESSSSEVSSLRKELLELREELTHTVQVESSKQLLIDQQASSEEVIVESYKLEVKRMQFELQELRSRFTRWVKHQALIAMPSDGFQIHDVGRQLLLWSQRLMPNVESTGVEVGHVGIGHIPPPPRPVWVWKGL